MKTMLPAGLCAALLLLPEAAMAHLVNSGLGPFYDGALHLLLSPEELIGVVAIAILGGANGARSGRLSVLFLSLSWLIAGAAGMRLGPVAELQWLSIAAFALPGLLVAFNVSLPPAAVSLAASACGLLNGLFNGFVLAGIGAGPLSLLGIVAGATVLCLLIAAFVCSLQTAWARIVIRVVGSWIAAVGMLMFGLLARAGF